MGGIQRLLHVSIVANKGLDIEEYMCSTTWLYILQFTHDRLASFWLSLQVACGLTLHVWQRPNHSAITVDKSLLQEPR